MVTQLESAPDEAAVARRAESRARAAAFARDSRAPATWRVYDAKWRRFSSWCDELGEEALPAEPRTVAEFLADLAAVWRPATPTDPATAIVEGQVPGPRRAPPRDGGGLPRRDLRRPPLPRRAGPVRAEAVRRVVSGIRRQRGLTPTRRRTALRPADMTAILAAMRPDERLVDARDAALLLIGWKAALRTDDLHRLDITDLKVESSEKVGGVVDGEGSPSASAAPIPTRPAPPSPSVSPPPIPCPTAAPTPSTPSPCGGAGTTSSVPTDSREAQRGGGSIATTVAPALPASNPKPSTSSSPAAPEPPASTATTAATPSVADLPPAPSPAAPPNAPSNATAVGPPPTP